MPDYQLTFDGGRIMPSEVAARCAGGCEQYLSTSDLICTPVGSLCAHCFRDLYIVCHECSTQMPIDPYGECDELCTAPDSVQRCRACAERLFSRCYVCGRMTPRASGEVRLSPDDADQEYCISCWCQAWFECATCGTTGPCDDSRIDPNEQTICFDCFDTQYVICSACRCAVCQDAYRGWGGDPYCENCYGHADMWKVQPWSGRATSFDRVGSERRFGVELETCSCNDWRSLHSNTEWGCVYECSTNGREFVSPILQGDEGFVEIQKMCSAATALNWAVDTACGLHIHLDVSSESAEECLRIAYAYRRTYNLWRALVPSHRRDNSMCGSPQYSCDDIRTFEHIEDFAELRDRFEFANWRAYIRHGSFEIRLYPGTLNAREVCAWIAIHARFMDIVKGMDFHEIDSEIGWLILTNWRGLCGMIDDTKLLDYWWRKAREHGTELPKPGEAETAVEIATESQPPEPAQVDRDSILTTCPCQDCRIRRERAAAAANSVGAAVTLRGTWELTH